MATGSGGAGTVSIGQADAAYEQCLHTALANILLDSGYQSCSGRSLHVLQAALEHFLLRVGRSARAYAEAAGRTHPVLGDATMALVDFGVTVSALIDFARQQQHHHQLANIPAVFGHDWLAEVALKRPAGTSAGAAAAPASSSSSATSVAARPGHVPEHLPPFPRPHTFVSTPAYRRRADDADVMRRRRAEIRRQTELSLTRFLAATGQTHSLFRPDEQQQQQDDPYLLTANELSPRPYVAALMAAATDAEKDATAAGAGAKAAKPRPGHPNPYMRPAKFPAL